MTHLGYVLASYGISAFVLAAVIGWILVDQRVQKRAMTELEAQGIRRRSDTGKGA